jgi:cyanophycinase
MNETDRYLLATLGIVEQLSVALLPTASGLEPGKPDDWNALGGRHFQQLGVRNVRATMIVERADGSDAEQLALLLGADLYYFSGGDPQHLIETLRTSPAWETIVAGYHAGAALAGCSAGAMALGGYTLSPRRMLAGDVSAWRPALGLLPRFVILPHFDRMATFLDQALFQQILQALPADCLLLGIDEDTALVRLEAPASGQDKARWRVMGRQTVSVFDSNSSRIFQVGDEVLL